MLVLNQQFVVALVLLQIMIHLWMTNICELVDRIIVLRNGKKIGERLKEQTNTNEIVSLITGAVA